MALYLGITGILRMHTNTNQETTNRVGVRRGKVPLKVR